MTKPLSVDHANGALIYQEAALTNVTKRLGVNNADDAPY